MQRLPKSKRKCENNHLSSWVSCRLLFFICWSQIYSLMYNSGHSEKHAIIFVLAPNERGSLEAARWHVSLGKLFWFLSYGMGSMFGLHHQSHRRKALWLSALKIYQQSIHPFGLTHQSFPAIFGVFPKTTTANPLWECVQQAHQAESCMWNYRNTAIFQFLSAEVKICACKHHI